MYALEVRQEGGKQRLNQLQVRGAECGGGPTEMSSTDT